MVAAQTQCYTLHYLLYQHLMIPQSYTPSPDCLNWTTSRFFDVIAGRCGSLGVNCTSLQRLSVLQRPHAELAHVAAAANAPRDACVEIGVSREELLTMEVIQSVNQGNRAQGGEREQEDFFFFFFYTIFMNIVSWCTYNPHQCSTSSLVSPQLLPAGSATQSSPFDKCSVNAQWLPCL